MSCDTLELLARLSASRRAQRLYPAEHPAVHQALVGLAESIGACHDEGTDVELRFSEGDVWLAGKLLPGESFVFEQLARDLSDMGAHSVILRRGLVLEEIGRAVAVLAADAATVESAGGIEALARTRRLQDVEIRTEREALQEGRRRGERRGGRDAYEAAVSLLRDLEKSVRAGGDVSVANADAVGRILVEHVLEEADEMLLVAGMKDSGEYTQYHSANVAVLSLVLGARISKNPRFLHSLAVGALLHDTGMLAIDRDVLSRPGALDSEEWGEVRCHPVTGARLLSHIIGLDKSAVVTALEHHMRYDGSGYPDATTKRRQHITSRIVAVADSYDAMTSERSYSAARTPQQAMAVLAQEAGSALDPDLVRLFMAALGVYPPRSVVRLSSGEIGIVVRATDKLLLPVVRVIEDAEGQQTESADLDLSTESCVSVKECVDPRLVEIDADEYI